MPHQYPVAAHPRLTIWVSAAVAIFFVVWGLVSPTTLAEAFR